jgi:parvulin-like peptidyl-prolyl isomerase
MLEMGQDFGELAAKNSGDPGSKDSGGELGWMSEGQTVPPFEAAMKVLELGELSGVVETRYGFHIIKLQERRGGDAVPYDEVKQRIQEFLKQRGLQERIQQELETLRNAASIELFI